MRVGVLIRGDLEQLDWAHRLGFRSVDWMAFEKSPCAGTDWKPFAEHFAGRARELGLRISAIGALYRNPLDPPQTDFARATFHRAIEVAAHIGVRNVCGFAGAVIELEPNPRGGNPLYRPYEQFIPQLLAFWEPIARFATDRGVRVGLEHCPQGIYHLPVMHYNMMGQPAIWERVFNETRCENLGLEWDPSHLVCQFIDPVANIHKFGSRIFHVHAKDAFIHRPLLETYGICHPGVAEHRFPGLGQSDWPQIVHALLRAGYDSDLNVEGWHDPVYRDHPPESRGKLAGRKLEDAGLLIARRTLEPLVSGTEPE